MSSTTSETVDILAAVFFVIAGAWLLIALFYSIFVLIFLRMRARGELQSIYDEDFGRLYLGRRNSRFYIPLGCIFRRYVEHLQFERDRARARAVNPHQMTPHERRAAMEVLLLTQEEQANQRMQKNNKNVVAELETGETMSLDEDEEDSMVGPICSICIGEYEESDLVLQSQTCSHQFHCACILDWLQRPSTTECPCCRVPMVSEDDVWGCVQENRRQKRRQKRGLRRAKRLEEEGVLSDEEYDEEAGNTERFEDMDDSEHPPANEEELRDDAATGNPTSTEMERINVSLSSSDDGGIAVPLASSMGDDSQPQNDEDAASAHSQEVV